MKTMKTNLEIGYDIEIMSIFEKQVELEVRCEEGQNTFYVDIDTVHDDLDNEEVFELLDYSQLDKWVNAQTVCFIASEVAKLCVMKSTPETLWSFNLFTQDSIIVSVYLHDTTNNLKCSSHHTATGEDKIKELLTFLKD